eukprot:GAHX01001736.1.p1 GENE.GAHX01001736.1~~GAHX01001736.1.p1  ORF type:complete len:781 (+),score=186.45 GAHX01001736.1:41-2344(+)
MPVKRKTTKKKPSTKKVVVIKATEAKKPVLKEDNSDFDYSLISHLFTDGESYHSHTTSGEGKSAYDPDIILENISVRTVEGSGPYLIKDSDVRFVHGRCYGIIGVNGAGKSTLLHYLAHRKLDGIPAALTIYCVDQETKGTSETALKFVVNSDKLSVTLLKAEKHLSSLNEPTEEDIFKLRKVTECLDGLNANTLVERAKETLKRLGFTEEAMGIPISDLSGGWRMRVSLAAALHSNADFLMLDEPTNHLDFDTLNFLVKRINDLTGNVSTEENEAGLSQLDLKGAKSANKTEKRHKCVIVVSHDRSFLNSVCTDIVHLNARNLTYYRGNFDTFLNAKMAKEKFQQTTYERQQREIANNEDFIRRFRANKKLASMAQSRMKVLDKMDRVDAVTNDKSLDFAFDDPAKLSNEVLATMEKVYFDYDPKSENEDCLLKNVNLKISLGDKIGLIGLNGSGKSTLIKLIEGQIEPNDGIASINNNMKIGYFNQHSAESLLGDLTPFDNIKHFFPDTKDPEIYKKLSKYGLNTETHLDKKVNELSGGLKARLNFIISTWYAPHFLLLDEPTNHLDHLTIDGLINALKIFKGTVFVVSHDSYFLESVCDTFLSLNVDGKIKTHYTVEEAVNEAYKLKENFTIKKRSNENSEDKDKIKKETENKTKEDFKDDELIIQFVERALDKGQSPKILGKMMTKCKASGKNTRVVNSLLFYLINKYFDEKKNDEVINEWKLILNIIIPHEGPAQDTANEIINRIAKDEKDKEHLYDIILNK